MKRRDFLKLTGGAFLPAPLSFCVGSSLELDPNIRVTRIVGFSLYSKRNKLAGKNAVKGVHGSSSRDLMIRVYTNAGVDGIGHCRADANAARKMVGRAIGNFYRAEHDPVSTDVLIADGFSIKDGYATVPDAPGFGLKIDEDKFASRVKVRFDLKA